MENLETLGGRLKWARDRLKLSQKALGKLVGRTQGYIGNLETEIRDVPRDILKLADVLGVTAKWLQYGEEPRFPPPKQDQLPSAIVDVQMFEVQEDLLKRVSNIIEVYRLASAGGRERIDGIVEIVRKETESIRSNQLQDGST